MDININYKCYGNVISTSRNSMPIFLGSQMKWSYLNKSSTLLLTILMQINCSCWTETYQTFWKHIFYNRDFLKIPKMCSCRRSLAGRQEYWLCSKQKVTCSNETSSSSRKISNYFILKFLQLSIDRTFKRLQAIFFTIFLLCFSPFCNFFSSPKIM